MHYIKIILDFLFSNIKIYRKICGGIWLKIHIIENPKYANGFAVNTWSGWVREEWHTTKKYWVEKVEAYSVAFHEKAKLIKAFEYSLFE